MAKRHSSTSPRAVKKNAVNSVAVIGAQWGDEGKGKIVDLLGEEADVIARFQGGNNAGHTVVVGSEQVILHLVPSGALHPGKTCVIGNGVVVDPGVLLEEIAALRARGYLKGENPLKLSERAHVIMPYHRAIDLAREKRRGAGKIGTTGRGIGPAYEDKMARVGIRVVDLMDESVLRERIAQNLEDKNSYLRTVPGEKTFELQDVFEEYRAYGETLRPYVTDTAHFIDDAIRKGQRVLFEGAQGTMLDIDHGTYPYVTSSTTMAAGVAAGSGIAPQLIGQVIGISKAYTTRVGGGPFPTELDDEVGEKLRRDGAEYGATTGRPRRCGWFDAVVVREAARLDGLTGLALTKLDVLRGLPRIRFCVGYTLDGARLDHPPTTVRDWDRVQAVFEEMEGWTEDISGARTLEDLPAAARNYIDRLSELSGVPLSFVSVGASRDATIVVSDPFGS